MTDQATAGMHSERCRCSPADCRDVWPVYSGRSFNLWEPDTGDYYDSACGVSMMGHLQPEAVDDPPCMRPRIVFRDVTRATDTRTMVCALIPGERVVVDKAPYLYQVDGAGEDEAYLLGVFSSMVFDWQMRRTVELGMKFGLLGDASVPAPDRSHPVRRRLTKLAGCLAAADERFADWAARLDVPVGTLRGGGDSGTATVDPSGDRRLCRMAVRARRRRYRHGVRHIPCERVGAAE